MKKVSSELDRTVLVASSFPSLHYVVIVVSQATARSAPDREKEINNLVSFAKVFDKFPAY